MSMSNVSLGVSQRSILSTAFRVKLFYNDKVSKFCHNLMYDKRD